MTAKHTPGPWTVGVHHHASGEQWLSVLRGAFDITHNKPAGAIAACQFSAMTDAENLANARLIAATPDLLEACQAIAAWDAAENDAKPFDADNGAGFYQRLELCRDAMNKARAAIARATGEPQA